MSDLSAASLVERVHQANSQAHDYCAATHDLNVPYISRNATRRYYWRLIHDAVMSLRMPVRDARVLELGCGTGTFTDLVLTHGARAYHGIDLSPRMIDRARGKIHDPRVTYEVVSLESFAPRNEERFDIIISASFLHHLVDVEAGLNCIRRLLRPGGVYVAIHEVITTRRLTRLERFDEALQIVVGARYLPWRKRVRKFCEVMPGISAITALARHARNLALRRNGNGVGAKPVGPDFAIGSTGGEQASLDYVDYQLNRPFSLSERARNFGDVTQYSYLAFTSLFLFGRPLNHEMLVMVRGAGDQNVEAAD